MVYVFESDASRESELAEAVKQLAIGQERFQTQILESLTNMSLASNQRFQGGTKGNVSSFDPRGNFKMCYIHESDTQHRSVTYSSRPRCVLNTCTYPY